MWKCSGWCRKTRERQFRNFNRSPRGGVPKIAAEKICNRNNNRTSDHYNYVNRFVTKSLPVFPGKPVY